MVNLLDMPQDLLWLIYDVLDYHSYLCLQITCKHLYNSKNYGLFVKKSNFIKSFMYKQFYKNYYDLSDNNRPGYLLNIDRVINYPTIYVNQKIQFISSFQYSFLHVEEGTVGEGHLTYDSNNDSWIIKLENKLVSSSFEPRSFKCSSATRDIV